MKLNAYLNFNGKCEEAFKFYERVLGGKVQFMVRYDEMPEGSGAPHSPETAKHIMHVSLNIGDDILMGSDAPEPYFKKAQGMSVNIGVTAVDEAESLFAALSEGAESVMMPLSETSWAKRFAMFVDRFGTPWMINCPKEM
jgi:PhnB protein